MPREYLKKATLTSKSDASETKKVVRDILDDIEAGGDAKALEYAAKFDKYEGEILLSDETGAAAAALVPEKLRRDIEFSHANVKEVAEAEVKTLANF